MSWISGSEGGAVVVDGVAVVVVVDGVAVVVAAVAMVESGSVVRAGGRHG